MADLEHETPVMKVEKKKKELRLPRFDEFDLETMSVRPADKGSASIVGWISIKHPDTGEDVPFVVKTPRMSLPFGVSDYVSDKTGQTSWSITASFEDENRKENEELTKYRNFLLKVQEKFIELFYPYSDDWLVIGAGKKKKAISKEAFTDMIFPIIRESANEKYADSVREAIGNEKGSSSIDRKKLKIVRHNQETGKGEKATVEDFINEGKFSTALRAVHIVGYKVNPSKNVLSPYMKVLQVYYYESAGGNEYLQSFSKFKLEDEDSDTEKVAEEAAEEAIED